MSFSKVDTFLGMAPADGYLHAIDDDGRLHNRRLIVAFVAIREDFPDGSWTAHAYPVTTMGAADDIERGGPGGAIYVIERSGRFNFIPPVIGGAEYDSVGAVEAFLASAEWFPAHQAERRMLREKAQE
jgi:hypothetical protein